MPNQKWIDLTPLLDIMMLILFAVLLNIQTEKYTDAQADERQMQALESLATENRELAAQKADLEIKSDEMNRFLSEWVSIDGENISILEPEAFGEELIKYNLIKNKFLFIDLALKTNDNRVFINKIPTNVYILYEQAASDPSRSALKSHIQELIEAQLHSVAGNKTFYLISLKADDFVYRYAYQLVWEVIKDIENKYGPDQIFKLEIY